MLFNKFKKKFISLFSEKKQIILLLAFLILTIYYISFTMSIFWDTAHYMTYVDIFEGKAPFSTWDIVRGPVFPLIIYISNYLFGKTTQGIVLLSFIFYLSMLFTIKKILDRVFENEKNNNNKLIYVIVFFFIILNPIIFGYYHTLLTEFVGMTISVVLCYFSWKWIDIDFCINRKKYLFYLFGFFVMSIVAWHLKQPYVSIALFPIIISAFLSIIETKTIKNSLERLFVVFMCIFGLLGSIKIWNSFLESKEINMNSDRNVTASLGKQLILGLNNYEIILNDDNQVEIKYLSNEKRAKLKTKDYYLINIYNLKKELIDQDIIPINSSQNISTTTSLLFISKELFNHPLMIMESYLSNYLAISNIYPKETEDSVTYYVNKKIDLKYCHENCAVATSITEVKSNIAYMLEDARERVSNYEQFNKSPIIFRYLLIILKPISLVLFKVIMLILPFFTILSTISISKKKNKSDLKLLNLINILLWYSFLHIIVHVVTGANIDRYAAPTIITSFVGIILYINFLVKIIKKKRVML